MSKRKLSDLLGPTDDEEAVITTDSTEISKGVSTRWLQIAFGMSARVVEKRLSYCPVKRICPKRNIKLYDLKEAASYLVKPQFDVGEYIRSMSHIELPNMLKKEFWQAEKLRLEYQEKAGELWPSEKVISVFAEAFGRIKNAMQVWVSDLERDTELSRHQFEFFQKKVDELREEIYDALVTMQEEKTTPSALGETEQKVLDVESD